MNRFVHISGRIGEVLGLASVLLVCYLVFSRYIFSHAYDWGDDVALIIMLYGVMFSAGELTRNGSHITVEFIMEKLKGKARLALSVANYLVMVAFCAVMTWAGIGYVAVLVAMKTRAVSSLGYPIWIIYLLFPLGLGLVGLCGIGKIVDVIKSRRAEHK